MSKQCICKQNIKDSEKECWYCKENKEVRAK